jgi:hypothetical protein
MNECAFTFQIFSYSEAALMHRFTPKRTSISLKRRLANARETLAKQQATVQKLEAELRSHHDSLRAILPPQLHARFVDSGALRDLDIDVESFDGDGDSPPWGFFHNEPMDSPHDRWTCTLVLGGGGDDRRKKQYVAWYSKHYEVWEPEDFAMPPFDYSKWRYEGIDETTPISWDEFWAIMLKANDGNAESTLVAAIFYATVQDYDRSKKYSSLRRFAEKSFPHG